MLAVIENTAMKLLSLLTMLLFAGLQARSQLAIINGPDGYTNIREGGSSSSKIVGRFHNDDIFIVGNETPTEEWLSVYQTAKSSYNQGYVHKSKIIEIEHLTQISKSAKNRRLTSRSLSISDDSIDFSILLKPFNVKEHKVKRNIQGFVETIDGTRPWGVDGGLPNTEISSLTFKIKGKSVVFPIEAYKDLYEVGLECMNLHFDSKGNIYIYFPCSSDGAGGYFAAWVIRDGKYKKRYVDAP